MGLFLDKAYDKWFNHLNWWPQSLSAGKIGLFFQKMFQHQCKPIVILFL